MAIEDLDEVQIVAAPGEGIEEAQVTHDSETRVVVVPASDIKVFIVPESETKVTVIVRPPA